MNWPAKMKAMLSDAIRLGRITAVDNSSPLQNVTVDVRVGVIDTKVARVQNYGFAGNPAAGDQLMGVEVTVNGNRFVVAIDDMGNRPKDGEAGDVWVYHREGHMIHLTKEQVINVNAQTLNMNVPQTNWTGDINHTGNTTQTGDTNQTGTITASVDVIAAGRSGAHHDHDYHPGPGTLTQTGEANVT